MAATAGARRREGADIVGAVPAELRPAATVVLLRDSPAGPEVWLMERSRGVAFMASAWVFPGGRVDDGDAGLPAEVPEHPDVPRAFWVAAARELEEEAGIRLGAERYELGGMRVWSHWLTPEVEPRRYDTWFFVASLPPGAEPKVDGGEAVRGGWFTAAGAIALASAGELPVAPPTLRTLQELLPYPDVASVLDAPRRTPAVCPKFQSADDGRLYVLLPGDPDHPSTERVDPPYRYVFEAGRWWAR